MSGLGGSPSSSEKTSQENEVYCEAGVARALPKSKDQHKHLGHNEAILLRNVTPQVANLKGFIKMQSGTEDAACHGKM